MKLLYSISLALVFFIGCAPQPNPKLQTVEKLDITRYSGKWIEIARYDNRFEEGCSGATADYTLNEGKIEVLNRCFDDKGKLTGEAHGSAYATDSSGAKLKVTFFWPFYGDYHVIMVADDYRYSVIGEPNRKYLWILSRTAPLSSADRDHILSRLSHFGYDASKLYWTSVRPQISQCRVAHEFILRRTHVKAEF